MMRKPVAFDAPGLVCAVFVYATVKAGSDPASRLGGRVAKMAAIRALVSYDARHPEPPCGREGRRGSSGHQSDGDSFARFPFFISEKNSPDAGQLDPRACTNSEPDFWVLWHQLVRLVIH